MAKAGVYINVGGQVNARHFRQAERELAKLKAAAGMAGAGATSAFAAASAKLKAFGTTARAAGASMTRSLTLPIVGLGVAAMSVFGAYEQQMNMFQAVTQASSAEMAVMSDVAKDLGSDLKLPGASAADAAETMTELAKGGLSVQESMDSARGTMQLAAAAGIENAEAAVIQVNALSAFGLAGQDAARVADLLAGSANASSGEITDTAAAFQMAATVFASNRMKVDDLSTAIGIMANAGIKGSDAGTSLKTMLLKLGAPTSDAAAALDNLGVSVYDASGTMKPMRSLIDEFSAATADLTDEQRNAAFATIFGTDAIRAANVLIGGGTEKWDEMATAVGREGQAAELAAAKNAGISGTMDALKSSAETLAIVIGEAFGPTITRVIGGLAGVVSKMADGWDQLSEPVQNAIGAFVLALAAVGPVTWIVGVLATGLGLLLTPVGAVALAVAAVAAAFYMAYTKVDWFREGVHDALAQVRAIAAKVFPFMVEKAEQVTDAWNDKIYPALQRFATLIADDVLPVVMDFVRSVVSEFERLVGFVRSKWGKIKEAITNVITVISMAVQGVLLTLTAVWDRFGDDIMIVVRGAFDFLKATIRNAMQVIRGVIDLVLGILTLDWRQAWEGIKAIFTAVLNQLGAVGKLFWSLLRGIFSAGVQFVQDLFRLGWTALKNIAMNAWGALTSWLSNAWGTFTAWWSEKWSNMGDTVGRAWDNIKAKAQQGADAVVGFIQGIPGRISALLGSIVDAGAALGSGILDGIKQGISGAVGFVADIASTLWTAVKDLINVNVIDRLNNAIPNSIGVGPLTYDIDDTPIPRLAHGGVVRARPGGTLALLGEAGSDEAVVPLNASGLQRSGMGGSSVTIEAGAVQVVVHAAGGIDSAAVSLIDQRVRAALAELARELRAGVAA